MQALENRIPPPLVAVTFAVLGLGLSTAFPTLRFHLPFHELWAFVLVGLGFAIAFSATRAFSKAETTIDPTRPERASALVTEGVFAWTRNPMYLGLATVLGGLMLAMGNYASLLAVPGLVLFLDRLQIQPEERILRTKLGEPYARYLETVRRWV